jgi:hypothetical protein
LLKELCPLPQLALSDLNITLTHILGLRIWISVADIPCLMDTTISHIVTHPGGAHKDEFLACCLFLARYRIPVLRKETTPAELDDPQIIAIDTGHRHEPERLNFDHHQFPSDHLPICSLSLVLQHFGLYEDAGKFCNWLEPLEWFDSKGAVETANWLDVDFNVVNRLNSPVDIGMLLLFASQNKWSPGDPLWEIMRQMGTNLLNYLDTMHARMEFIDQHREIWKIPHGGESYNILFMPRTDPLPNDPSLGLGLYIEQSEIPFVGLVYPDRRGTGYGLSRFNDYPGLDFNRVREVPGVNFAHARGFLAKTSITDEASLKQLLGMALIGVN